MMVVEVLNKLGKVISRSQHAMFPVHVGRAYDTNQVILDDEFVSPYHLTIEKGEPGPIRVVDLNSENGLYLVPGNHRVAQIEIDQEGLVRIGHTVLRVRTAAFVPPPTKQDTESLLDFLKSFNHGWKATGILVLTGLWMGLEVYWGNVIGVGWEELVVFPMWALVLIGVWAGSWALVNKISQHQYNFKAHGSIVCLALLVSSWFEVLDEYYAFAWSGGWSSEILSWGGASIILGGLLIGHLRLCTAMDSRRLMLNTGGVVLGVMGMVGFSSYVGSSKFLSVMAYHGELKPPAFHLADSLTLDEFFGRSHKLKKKIDDAIREESSLD